MASASCRRNDSALIDLVGELRAAGVDPGGQPVGADVGGGVGELADQGGGGLVVETVEVFVVVGFAARGERCGPRAGSISSQLCALRQDSKAWSVGSLMNEASFGRIGKKDEKRSISVMPKRSLMPVWRVRWPSKFSVVLNGSWASAT